MSSKYYSGLLFGLVALNSWAQSVPQAYIDEALQQNIALQNKEYSYLKSLAVLWEAKGAFLPTISLVANYATAQGQNPLGISPGEVTDPLFNNLNLINQTLAQIAPGYPDIPTYGAESNELNTALNTNQQTAVRLSVPLFNALIIKNHRIKKQLVTVEELSVEAYRRQLVKEVKLAYIQYSQAEQLANVAEDGVRLAREAVTATEALYQNDKITRDELHAVEASYQEAVMAQLEAEKRTALAQAYFNFLLNRPVLDEISVPDTPVRVDWFVHDLGYYQEQTVKNRIELEQLAQQAEVTQNQVGLRKAAYFPTLSVGAEAGFRGTEYAFDQEHDYVQVGGQLSWDLFAGFRRSAQVAQAQIDHKATQNQRRETESQLLLAVTEAYYEASLAWEKIDATDIRVQEASQAFQLVKVKYANGLANRFAYDQAETEYLDALTRQTLAVYEYWSKKITLMYEAGL